MPKLVCVRHGQSIWNLKNLFTGWVDVDLTDQGILEAKKAGSLLKEYKFDHLFTSVLTRAINTANIIQSEMGVQIETTRDQSLNERHYGDLQGQNKAEVGEKFGKEQLHIWRRSFDTPPPNGESLKMTRDRVVPYYNNNIKPFLENGKNILIVAHGNSLRGLIMYLEGISENDIPNLNIPTGSPYLYEMDEKLNITLNKYL
ncbi:2,3-bisphosphoglycerate-dependent phosphoglycerate mutase [Candidatus Kapabacteria bacterium]|nr:2,3-bisphosphoglycerate-dependent phosphoglycerate mutase [Candidatus Kapabacteria bacterium]